MNRGFGRAIAVTALSLGLSAGGAQAASAELQNTQTPVSVPSNETTGPTTSESTSTTIPETSTTFVRIGEPATTIETSTTQIGSALTTFTPDTTISGGQAEQLPATGGQGVNILGALAAGSVIAGSVAAALARQKRR